MLILTNNEAVSTKICYKVRRTLTTNHSATICCVITFNRTATICCMITSNRIATICCMVTTNHIATIFCMVTTNYTANICCMLASNHIATITENNFRIPPRGAFRILQIWNPLLGKKLEKPIESRM